MFDKAKLMEGNVNLLMYADDGIFYSDKPIFDLDP